MHRAAVVGTGLMGPTVAAAFANAGMGVSIIGRNPQHRDHAVIRARELVESGMQDHLSAGEWEDLASADIVSESVLEDQEVKAEVLSRISEICDFEAIITTNTSSLSLSVLAESVTHPDRFAGMHFLNPAHATSVVEIIGSEYTSPATVQSLSSLVEDLGKRPIVVRKEIPGFVWNRIQIAVLRECFHLLAEGVVSVSDIDAAVSQGLAPRWVSTGPLMTIDLGGKSVFCEIARRLLPTLSNTSSVPPRLLDEEDFYEWNEERRDLVDTRRTKALRVASVLSLGYSVPVSSSELKR